MRFSLTGDQADAALLVQSIAASAGHSLDVMQIRGALEDQLQTVTPPDCRRVASAEEVFVASDIDAVIIAESQSEDSIRVVRQASQSDCHVLVIPPEDVSTAWSYELHLLLDESQYGIVVLTGRWYVETDHWPMESVIDCRIGLPAVADDPNARMTLLHAIDISAALGFAGSQITVLGAAEEGNVETSRQVVLSGTGADGQPAPGVTLQCSRSEDPLLLRGRTDSGSVERAVIIPGHSVELPDAVRVSLCDRLTSVLEDAVACQRAMEQLSRSLQVLEAVAKSIRRRRTVDVYADELTERSVFKTQMTAIGCGVLTWMMLGMIGYLLIGQLFEPPVVVMQILRAVWITPVVLFLLAQLLLPLARGRMQGASSTDAEQTSENHAHDSASHSG